MGRLHLTRERLRRFGVWCATPAGMSILFVAALALRMLLARGGGFPYDMTTFRAWSAKLGSQGPYGFYDDPKYFVDYPPGYLYVLWVLGLLTGSGGPGDFALKIPAILTDLALAAVVVRIVGRVWPSRAAMRPAAAAFVLFNPAFFFVSSVWGQVDSILAVLVLSGLLLLAAAPETVPDKLRREMASVAVFAAALVTKPQAAFVLPVVGVVLLWRHILTAPGAAAARRGAVRILALGLFAFGVVWALMLPFGLPPTGWVRFYTHAASTYPYTSVWAFNLWGAVGFWKRDLSGRGAVNLFGVPALYVSVAAFGAGLAYIASKAWSALRRGEQHIRVGLAGAATLTCLAFAVLTRMHERYLMLALACLAPLAALRPVRRVLAALSVLYLANVYFAYVYYVDYVGRPSTKIPGYRLLFGNAVEAVQLKIISLATAAVCLYVVVAIWRWLAHGHTDVATADTAGDLHDDTGEVYGEIRVQRPAWTLHLHDIGRRGAALAVLAGALIFVTRLPGIESPPGMYFDEVYHARTAGEYIQRREVYEWTHPPLAKEMIAAATKVLARPKVGTVRRLPPGMRGAAVASDGSRVAWASPDGSVRTGVFDECRIVSVSRPIPIGDRPGAVAVVSKGPVVAGGAGFVARVENGRVAWRRDIPGRVTKLAALQGAYFAVTQSRTLYRIDGSGAVTELDAGVTDLSAAPDDQLVWAAYPDARKAVAFGVDGAKRWTIAGQSIGPARIFASAEADRVVVTAPGADVVESAEFAGVGSEGSVNAFRERLDVPSDAGGQIPSTGMLWLAGGRRLSIVEPRGLSVIGSARLPFAPRALIADQATRRIVAVGPAGYACVGSRYALGWRIGSAATSGLAAALIVALALRLFERKRVALFAFLAYAFDGLAFTMARISMIDAYVAAFIAGAWLCAVSLLHAWDREDRASAVAWLGGCGIMLGFAASSKWVGIYTIAGVGLFLGIELLRRGRRGLWRLAGPVWLTAVLFAVALLGVPALIYVASYSPYFGLGHSFGELLALQRSMYEYHAHLVATHPYSSPWWGWPFGYRAVYMHVQTLGALRGEIWNVANPVIFLGGLGGLVAMSVTAVRRRALAQAIVPWAWLAQMLPWTAVGRITFFYHYLPMVTFVALGLGWWLAQARKRWVASAVLALAAAFFALLFPLMDATMLQGGILDGIKNLLPWLFRPF